jgi:septal ring factor EnvC (AmiA/AmiB activator)
MAGDVTAQDNFTGVAQAFLDASRVINASSQGYTDTYNKVMADIDRLSASTSAQITNAEAQLKALQDQVARLDTLNATAQDILTNLVAPSPLLQTSVSPVVVDTSSLEAQIAELRAQLAEANTLNAKQMDDLMGVVFNSQTTSAGVIAEAVTSSTSATVWADKTGKLLENER